LKDLPSAFRNDVRAKAPVEGIPFTNIVALSTELETSSDRIKPRIKAKYPPVKPTVSPIAVAIQG